MSSVSDADLANFMDEALSAEEMSRIESALRDSAELRRRLDGIRQARDRGWHSVGAIWRGHRLSCPTRSQLGSFLLDALDPDWQSYIHFHLTIVGCRMCLANLSDLRSRQEEQPKAVAARRRQIFESSVGRLSRR